jgi:preprotein translocase subunit YajC
MKISESLRHFFPAVLLIMTFSYQSTPAQVAKNDWSEVEKTTIGATLKVKTKAGEVFEGKVTGVSSDSLKLSLTKISGQEKELKKDEIAEVRKKSRGRTAGYAGVMGGLGAAAGYGVGYGIGEAKQSRFRPEYPTAAVGAAAGAIIGAIMGSKGQVIYKAQ